MPWSGPGGWLLNDDAVAARTAEFDDWAAEQRRAAEETAQRAADALAQRQAEVQQAAQAAAQQASERLQQFDDWRQQQQAAADQSVDSVYARAASAVQPIATAVQDTLQDTVSPVVASINEARNQIAQQPDQPAPDDGGLHVFDRVQQSLGGLGLPAGGLADVVQRGADQLRAAQDASDYPQQFAAPMTALSDAASRLGEFNQQQQEQAVQDYTRIYGAPPRPVDFSQPIGPQVLGEADPYSAIVQRGVPQILQGIQDRDLGAVAGGALQTLLGAASVLPGTGGEATAARVAEPLAAAAEPVASRVPGAVERFLTGEGSEAGSVSLRAGATLGGAVAGGLAGNATTPDDAMTVPTPLGDVPLERGVRILGGAAAGAGVGSLAGFSGTIDQTILDSLRNAGLVAGPARAAAPYRGVIPEIVDQTKQALLTSPTTHIGNVIGNTIELARQPVSLALGGRADDALAGITAAAKALPQAAGDALSALRGAQQATLSNAASNIPLRQPIYRILSASDVFTRTLGEYQGMASTANQLLRDAGMAPGDPGAAAYLASHAADLYQAGAREGAQSVFGQAGATATGGRSALEDIFRVYGNYKEGLLASPDRKSQALGALLDFQIPFSGVPSRLVEIAANRTPPGAQIGGAWRTIQALRNGDTAAAQRFAGETALESSIEFLIAKNIADGNIRGPDDLEHPNGINLPGLGWVDTREWGAYALPMQIMASFADGYQKGSQDPRSVDSYAPQFNAALNASMKPFAQAIPGANLLQVLSLALQGSGTTAAMREVQDAVSRLTTPGAARFIENATDPFARQVAKQGVQALWEPSLASWPGLAQRLPQKIDPTTGEPQMKLRSGLGTLVGAQQDVVSSVTAEVNRLRRLGYIGLNVPSQLPSAAGLVNLPDGSPEQRAAAMARAQLLQQVVLPQISSAGYQRLSDVDKARMLDAVLNAADSAAPGVMLNAAMKEIGPAETQRRMLANQSVAGRLTDAARQQRAPAQPEGASPLALAMAGFQPGSSTAQQQAGGPVAAGRLDPSLIEQLLGEQQLRLRQSQAGNEAAAEAFRQRQLAARQLQSA